MDAASAVESQLNGDTLPRPSALTTNNKTPGGSVDELNLILANAEQLLAYAVEAGIEIDAQTSQRIISASRAGPSVWDGSEAGALIVAITALAAKVRPVTAETLRACRADAAGAIKGYKHIAYWLAAFIIPLSMLSFIYVGISNSITTGLKATNDLAVSLHTGFDSNASSGVPEGLRPAPAGALSELQQFAAGMRGVYSRTRELSWFFPFLSSWDPLKGTYRDGKYPALEISPSLQPYWADVKAEVDQKTAAYQQVRAYATSIQDAVALLWGAIGSCILPVLYALLGACAYMLRTFTQQVAAHTFEPSFATPARFIVAAIGGAVVGLFNNFTVGQGTSLSPLAIAFLVGYASDIFFSFLEGSMQGLGKSAPR